MIHYRRVWLAGIAGLLMLAVTVTQARALMVAPPAVAVRVATADLIVIGKVTGYGPKLLKAEMFKGDTRDMQIAIIKVEDTLVGKAGKEIKVGFIPPPTPKAGDPKIRPITGRYPTVDLKQDQEVCVFLVAHPTQKGIYMAANYYDAIPKTGNAAFAKDVEQIKTAVKLLAKPMDGLKSKDADQRFLTAALLISRYRTPKRGATKTEEVSAEESKLILQTLAEADWTGRTTKLGFQMTPLALFARLGLTPEDGWKQKPGSNYANEAKNWLKENGGKYRVKRDVAPAATTEPEPKSK